MYVAKKDWQGRAILAYSRSAEEQDQRRFLKRIERDGCEIVVAGPQDLLLDIDEEMSDGELTTRIQAVEKDLGLRLMVKSATESSSGWPHMHVHILSDRPIPEDHKPFIQCALGSSYRRELHNMRRAANGINPSNLFIEGDWKQFSPERSSD